MTATTANVGAKYRHTDQPVRRCSYDIADPRAQVFRPIGDGTKEGALDFIEAVIASIKAWTDDAKVAGSPHPLTQNAIHLVDRMLRRCTDFKTGRCEPTIDHIMSVVRFSRATVIKLLAHLREHGFIDWARRTERTGNTPGEGPTVRQVSNAYFVEISQMPKKAQFDLRQRLKRRARQIFEYPERTGSGPVPSRAQSRIRAMVRGLTYAFGSHRRDNSMEAYRTSEGAIQERLDALPPEATLEMQAAALFPGDQASQDWHISEIRKLSSGPSASLGHAPESPP